MVAHGTNVTDPMEDRSIHCELAVLPSGLITVLRSPGCTHADVVDICLVISHGAMKIHDITPAQATHSSGPGNPPTTQPP